MPCRGIRGATTVKQDTSDQILDATCELLSQMVEANNIKTTEIASAIFTVTPDLKSAFPAQAARHLGWTDVPLLCAQEIDVTNRLDRCIRILLHWNTDKSSSEIIHIYINGAKVLRPDWVARQSAQSKRV